MKSSLFILMLLIFGCSQVPVRKPASREVPMRHGEVSHTKSFIQIFPVVTLNDQPLYYFYLQLKDPDGEYVDCDPSEITLKTHLGKKVFFTAERFLVGRYYLTIEKTNGLTSGQLDFFVRGKPLKEQFKLSMGKPDKVHTKITMKKKLRGKIKFQLRLADKANRPVMPPEPPEIVVDGEAEIDDLRHIHEGIWEFTLTYAEHNQILYLSVRSQGAYFPNLFRYHHVEK